MRRAAGDDDLMAAIAVGDQEAFAELLRRHRPRVCRLIQAFVHDADQAEDLTQDVFCRVFQTAGTYRAGGAFTAWLKRVAINHAKNALRCRRRSTTEVPVEEVEERTPGAPDPLDILMADGLREEVRDALQSLPDEQRLVLILRYFGDMTVPDIAWALRCPEGTVKSRLFHGLRKVRSSLAGH